MSTPSQDMPGPCEVGLPARPRRRTPGLRREEVAQLTDMATDYIARLEQARPARRRPRAATSTPVCSS